MYIIVEGQLVYVSDAIASSKTEELSALCTDKLSDEEYSVYIRDKTSYKITTEGKFVRLRDFGEQKSRLMNKRYIPNHARSVNAKVKYALAGDTASDEYKLSTAGLYSEWAPSSYAVGDIRNRDGQTWECIQAHDNAVYPDITPDNPQTWHTFWKPLHGKSGRTARPWVKPQYGTTDMYHTGEYMIWTDGKRYKCLSDTVYSPEEYAQAWEQCKSPLEVQS